MIRLGGIAIDTKTLIILDAFGNLLGALLIYAYNKRHFSRTVKYHLYSQILFGLTFSLFIVGMFLFNNMYLAIANCSLIFGGGFEVFAIMQLTNNNNEKIKKVLMFVLALVSLVQASFAVIIDVSNLRIALVTTTLSMLWLIIVYLLMKPKNSTLLQKMVGIFFLVTAGSLILRSLQALDLSKKFDLLTPGFAQILTFAGMFMIMIVSGFGIPLLSKERADEQLLISATYDGLTNIYNSTFPANISK